VDLLCVDKTGTLTKNQLSVDSVQPLDGYDEAHVLTYAALASDQGGQDPVDPAIRDAGSKHGMQTRPTLEQFTAFDPAKRLSEATVTVGEGKSVRVVKGAFETIIALCAPSAPGSAAVQDLEGRGCRVLAVADGPAGGRLTLNGLIALRDPPRSDSAALITELRTMGVRTVMATGDAAAAAGNVARAVGLDGAIYPGGPLPEDLRSGGVRRVRRHLPRREVRPGQELPELGSHRGNVR
jgi:H+-transporting ATPase